jgi:MFS transporter, ACS family, glucarate transporter
MGTPPLQSDHVERPSRVRFVVLTHLCLLAFILYLDRVCIGQAGPAIAADLGLDDTQLGIVFASFTLAYGLFQSTAGRLSDRFGSRGVLVAIVIWWSVFTALTGACTSWYLLIAVRFVFGLGEAGAFPNCARILNRWFPPQSRGLPQGLMNTAALVGGALAPVAVASIMGWLDGLAPFFLEHFGTAPISWRWSFLLFGLLGLVWAAVFWRSYRDNPAQHPRVNDAERRLINDRNQAGQVQDKVPPVPWRLVLRSRNVWVMGLIMNCSCFVSYPFMSWLPTYLQKGRGLDNRTSSWQASIVLGAGAVGSALGGVLIDWLLRRGGGKRTRCRLGFVVLMAAGMVLALSFAVTQPLTASLIMALAFLLMMLHIASWWGVVSDISGPHMATLFGLMNSMGIIGATGALSFFGWMADLKKAQGFAGRDQWDPAMYYCVATLFLGAICWLFVNPERSAVE